jgi:hypothetical protein
MAKRWTVEDFTREYLSWRKDNEEEVGVSFSNEGMEIYLDEKPYVLTLTPIPPTLAELGLEMRDVVRFRDRAGANWKTGTVRGTNKDGSVVICQDSNGFSRSIMPEFVEKKGTGKRGAAKWISLSPG